MVECNDSVRLDFGLGGGGVSGSSGGDDQNVIRVLREHYRVVYWLWEICHIDVKNYRTEDRSLRYAVRLVQRLTFSV